MWWVRLCPGQRQCAVNVALNVAARLINSITYANIMMYVDWSCWMHLIIGTRGLHELQDRGTPWGPLRRWVQGTRRRRSDHVFLHVCLPPPPSIVADCTPYTVKTVRSLYCPVMTAVAAVVMHEHRQNVP